MDDEKKQSPEASPIYANDFMELSALNEQDADKQFMQNKYRWNTVAYNPYKYGFCSNLNHDHFKLGKTRITIGNDVGVWKHICYCRTCMLTWNEDE